MFIRFYSGETDERSQVATGLFCAASELRWSKGLPDYEFDALNELKVWFNENMDSPYEHLRRNHGQYDRAICWFRASAHEHLRRAWELVTILERNDILIWSIKSSRPGYIYYEDQVQVFALPYNDVVDSMQRR